MAAAAKFVDALERDGAELRKSRLKLDEIVYLLKTGTDPASIQHDIESAIEQTRATLRTSQSVGDLKKLKTIAREALGLGAEPRST